MKAQLTILGCGNSSGVPAAGNHWGECDPKESRNWRTRSSAVLQTAETTLVIDTGADFRHQTIRENISHIDAVFYSHYHSDHVNGMDDLRGYAFRNKRPVPIYGSQETLTPLEKQFPYIFQGGNHELYPPILEPHIFWQTDFGTVKTIGNIPFTPFEMDHGSCQATGYRFGDTAYCMDMLTLDNKAIEVLKGVKNWIVDSAAYKTLNNKVHANLETIYSLNKEIQAQNVYLGSLSVLMDYKTLCSEVPEGYAPAYDGLKIDVNL